MKRIIYCIFYLLINTFFLIGQDLIPSPEEIQFSTGFHTVRDIINVINVNANAVDVNHLTDYFKGNKISVTQGNRRYDGESNVFIEIVDSTWQLGNYLESINLDGTFEIGEEGYILKISTSDIHLLALSDTGVFYGIQTLKQLFNTYSDVKVIPSMSIYDRPDIAIRGWQDDISRGPIPSMEFLKEQIRIMSSFKLNHFTLYTEHVFKLDKHPSIAPKDGITKAELKDLTAYARKHHVTLIGNYQSFGHMEETLIHPDYNYLAENDHIISPALEESYSFLSDVYEEIVPQYDSQYFNINCDETFGLGVGQSKAMVDSLGVSGVYVYHINKLDALLSKYDKKILMWGDIATSYPEIVPSLPKDMTVIPWGYHAADSFDYAITPIANQGLDFWIAPGVSCWQNIFPDLETAEINIYNFIRDGYKLGALGVLNTSWDDDGLNLFNNNWHGLAWGAENSWNAPPNLTKERSEQNRITRYIKFNRAFDFHFFGINNIDESITSIMHEFSLHHSTSDVRSALKNVRFLEPVFPLHLDYVNRKQENANVKALLKIDSLVNRLTSVSSKILSNHEVADYLLFALHQTRFTLSKNLFRISLYQYLNGESDMSLGELKSNKKALIQDLKLLKGRYVELWKLENRDYWLSVNVKLYDDLINSLIDLDGYVLILPSDKVGAQGREVVLNSVFNDYPIRYALNEATVTSTSTLYTKPFYINTDVSIVAQSFSEGNGFEICKLDLLHHKAVGSLKNLNSKYSDYHPSYDGGGMSALLDGKIGDKEDLKSGKWQGFSGQDIEVEMMFTPEDTLTTFSMGFYQNTNSWVIFPTQVEIYTKSDEGESYKLLKVINGTISPKKEGNLKDNYTCTLENICPYAMKVVARNYGKLPEWHHAGSTYDSMIFADEIIIQ